MYFLFFNVNKMNQIGKKFCQNEWDQSITKRPVAEMYFLFLV